jgi:alpha-glucosidase (family GH31 glycosyl hydrolase)
MMQFSAAPWRWLSPDNLNLCLEAARLHLKMAPEILALAKESAQSGEPIMRHLEYTFPGLGYERINDQFLLGDTILVAPVVKKGLRSRMVIFPPGKWRNEQDVEYRGPGAFEVPAPLELLPWFRQIAYSE